MTATIASALPPAAPPAPAAPNAPAESAQSSESGFAALLKGQPAPARPQAQAKAQATRPEAPADEAKPSDEKVEETRDDDAGATFPAELGAPVDPALAHWLAGLHMPAAGEARSAASAAGGATPGEDGNAGEALAGLTGMPGGAGSRAARGGGIEGKPAAELRAAARDAGKASPVAAADARDDNPRAAPAAALNAASTAKAAAFELPPLPAAPAAAPATPTAAAPTPLDVALPLAPDAPEFADAFAAQVSVLARDGVQQAELHLNPAETGPVSIQIVLDGTQARIDFGADALPTRQAIEHSLPELAAALREQGLTLSGGGVSEHSRGRAPHDFAPSERDTGPRRRAEADEAVPVLRSVRMSRGAGGLDLYA